MDLDALSETVERISEDAIYFSEQQIKNIQSDVEYFICDIEEMPVAKYAQNPVVKTGETFTIDGKAFYVLFMEWLLQDDHYFKIAFDGTTMIYFEYINAMPDDPPVRISGMVSIDGARKALFLPLSNIAKVYRQFSPHR